MGAAVAWQAALRGLTVAAFDAHEPPHALGSTHGHSRIIRELYFEHPQYVPLVQRAYALWAELEAKAGTRLYQACGGLMVGRPGGVLVAGTLRAASEHALPVQTWDASQVRARVSGLAPDDDMVGVFEPRAGVLTPERSVSAMLEQARRAGARLFLSEPVRRWTATGGHVDVYSDGRHVRARHLVLAAGPWLASLLGQLRLPLTVERVVQHWYPTSGRRALHAGGVPGLSAGDARWSHAATGCPIRAVASSSPSITAGPSTTGDDVSRTVSSAERAIFHAFASRWIRDLPAGPVEDAVCLYTNTPDGDFILDWHPAAPRGLRLQCLLGTRLQVRTGHRRGCGVCGRHGHVTRTIWNRSAWPDSPDRSQGRTDPRGRLSRSV